MINIKTQTGCWLDSEDSKKFIQHELNSKFSTFEEYFQSIALYESPDYWGEYILNDPESEYKLWITKVAKETLPK